MLSYERLFLSPLEDFNTREKRMKVTDGMRFKAFWFEEGDELVHLPHWMMDETLIYDISRQAIDEERECRMFQFLVNGGHIWTYSARYQKRATELIRTGKVQFYTDAHRN
jgi:hypothetical protein